MRAPAGDQFRRTAATASVQKAPSALKYQRTGEYSKGSKTHPKLSPAETQPSCDASRHRPTGRSFFCYEFQTITTFVVAAFQ